MNGCQHWVYPTNDWGKLPKRKCNKPSVIIDTHGRELCKHHYNRWLKFINKNNPK